MTTIAKSVAPSMRAAAMIIEVRMSPAAVGWRAEPSIAAAASLPMPRPAPMTARPAPKPAERKARADGFMGSTPDRCVCAGLPGREFPVARAALDYPWPGDAPAT